MARVEVRDVPPGLWLWRVEHPTWQPGTAWEPLVASTVVESGGETLLLDPLVPPDESEVWGRLEARPPTVVVVLKPDHVRDGDLFVRRYDARAFGPWLFRRDNIPQVELEPVQPGMELPDGLVALSHGEPVHSRDAYERALELRPGAASGTGAGPGSRVRH
jgi:hypothetical protein